MASREAYARGSWTDQYSGIELHPGVEIRDGDDVEDMSISLQILSHNALEFHGGHHTKLVEFVELGIKECWPGRAYFIETDECGRGVQVFQPYGLPRDKPITCEVCLHHECEPVDAE